jgi:hypothetical protein
MAFQIRTAKDRKIRPEGNYIKYQNREWLVQGISLTDSGNVSVKLHNYLTFENQILTLCNLEELESMLNQKFGDGQ